MRETVSQWCERARKKLEGAKIPSSNLDAELILSRVLHADRAYIHAHPDKKLTFQQTFHANNWLNQRARRVPLAYIFGEKEFYGRDFYLNSNVLVPRPETETLIDCAKNAISKDDILLDIGTGSGIIPVTLAAEIEGLEVFASDVSIQALAVANINAKKILGKKIPLFESNLLQKIPSEILSKITIITANLPYVDKKWIDFSEGNELHHEPQIALYADEGGVALYQKMFLEIANLPSLKSVIIEADPEQFSVLESIAQDSGFSLETTENYTMIFSKNK